tara:strand:+ start:3783 stop:4499 length:717 start_codon:yes stop_codon:yes gene_type:complete
LYGLLVISFFTGAANVINDSLDYKTDLINNPERPIPKGEISPFNAMIFSIFLFLIGAYFSLFLNQNSFFLSVFIGLPLIIFYSLFFKNTPIYGNIIVSLIIGLAFVFIASLNNNFNEIIPISILGFSFTFARELIKDIADYEGDKSSNINTFPVIYGIKYSIKLVKILTFFLAFGVLIPYFVGIFSIKYLMITFFGISIPLFFIIIFLSISPTPTACNKSSKIIKLLFLVGLIAIYYK